MNKAWAMMVAAALVLPGCQGQQAAAPPLAGARIGGPFVLTDQDGRRFDSRRLAGRYAAIYFGYTSCPDVCPTDMLALSQGLRAFAKQDPARAAKVALVFVSVDPQRDTPAVLKQFVSAFPPAIGLTGSPEEIARVAKDYAVMYRAEPPAKGAAGYLVDHSRTVVLFGPDGKPVVLVPADGGGQVVTETFSQWVK